MLLAFLRDRICSVRDAVSGIAHLLRTEPNAWIHLAATAGVVALAAVLRISLAEWCWLFAAIALVWIAEAFNTALELLADAACPTHHPLIGRAKDVAAAAVLVSACAALAIGACILGPPLLE